jgi:TolB protein
MSPNSESSKLPPRYRKWGSFFAIALMSATLLGCLEPFEPVVVSVMVMPAEVQFVSVGETALLTAVARDMDGEEIPDKTFTWSSSDYSTVMVDSEGLVTALGNGSATVVATCDGVTGSAAITVEVRVAMMDVVPYTSTLSALGDSVHLTATARDAYGNPVVGGTVIWSSSDATVATVDFVGVVRAVGNGTVIITAASDGVLGDASVTVAQQPAVITVTPASATIPVIGDTLTLSAVAFDARSYAIAAVAFNWSSSNEGVAIVGSSGLVTGVAKGSVLITAAIGDVHGTALVTVVESGERIVFQRDGDVWIMEPDGSGVLNLTNSPSYDAISWQQSPWSPDGSRIAFISDRDGNQEIYVTDIAGATLTKVTSHYASDIFPHWSPDGTKLVFTKITPGGSDIYVVNADGTGTTDLTYDNPGVDYEPAWSPDGTQIAFLSNRGGSAGLWLMRADGSDPTVLYPDSVQTFAWSPNGTHVAMQKPIGPGYTSEITVMNVADGREDSLTINSDWDGLGSWSPDGTRIAFTGERNGTRHIFVINADGTGLQDLTFDSTTDDGSPTWSPDGEWIAFISSNPESYGDIWVIRPDGSGLAQLTNSPEWEYRPVWSP